MFSTLAGRFKAPTPVFWQKARNRAALCVPVVGGVLQLPLQPMAATILSHLAAGLGFVAVAAQFACDGPAPAIPATPAPAATPEAPAAA
jgi:hypothetical protein